MIDLQRITHHAVMVLPPVYLSHSCPVNLHLHYHYLSEQRQHDRSCGGICRPFIARHVPPMLLAIEPHVALDKPLDQQPSDGQHGQGRYAFGFLQPPRGNGRRILAPPQSRFSRAVLFLISA